MRLTALKSSSNSVVIKYTDPELIKASVCTYFKELCLKHEEINRGLWFGSWITGTPSPGSDVDICLILSFSPKPIRERIADYLPDGFPVGIDLFPYTEAEFSRLAEENPCWYRCITSGIELSC